MRFVFRNSRLVMATLIALTLTACAQGPDSGKLAPPAGRNTALDDLFPIEQVTRSQAAFYHALSPALSKQANYVFSPYAVSAALTALAQNGEGTTAEELAVALRHPTDSSRLTKTYTLVTESLPWNSGPDHAAPRITNQLWAGEGVTVAPSLQEHLDAFRLTPTTAPDATGLRLESTATVEGPFLKPMVERLTKPQPFQINDKLTVETPLMRTVDSYRWAGNEYVDLIEVPYVGDELALILVVPKFVDGLRAVEAWLPDSLDGWLTQLTERHVDLQFPPVTLVSEFSLDDALRALGVKQAYAKDAQFSGVIDGSPSNLGGVLARAELTLGEYGSGVTEASPEIMERLQGTRSTLFIKVAADRPFAFVVRDYRRGAWLLAGRITDPRQFVTN